MWHEYVKIRGYDGNAGVGVDPGTFEVFQGIGPAGSSSGGDGGDNDQPYEPVDIEKLQKWLDAVDAWVTDEELWIDATIAYTGTRDVPAPMPPQLPDLTDFVSLPALIGQFGPWGVVIWVGLKIIRRILEAWLEKQMNPSLDLKKVLEEIRDSIKKGLLYNNDTDSILLKAFLGEDFKSYLAALPDLAYIDHIIDFGAFRCHIKGKMIEY